MSAFEKWWSAYCDTEGTFDIPEIEASIAWNAALDSAAAEARHFQAINSYHKCGTYIESAILALKDSK